MDPDRSDGFRIQLMYTGNFLKFFFNFKIPNASLFSQFEFPCHGIINRRIPPSTCVDRPEYQKLQRESRVTVSSTMDTFD